MDFLSYLGQFLLATLLSELLRPKIKRNDPAAAGLKDLSFPTADENRVLAWLIGRQKQDAPNLLGTFDFASKARTKRVRTGLFSKETMTVGYDYYCGFAMALCAGSGVRLKEIWAGDKMIWSGDVGNGASVTLNYQHTENGSEELPTGYVGVVDFFSGSTVPSAYLEAKMGAGNAPAWPHCTYVVCRGPVSGVSSTGVWNIASAAGMWVGTNPSVEPLSFVIERMPSEASIGLGVTLPGTVSVGSANGNANLALAMAELLTDATFWAGIHPDFISASSFVNAAATLTEEAHYGSMLIDNQRSTWDVVMEMCRQIGGVLQPDPATGNHTLRLLRNTDTPVLALNDTTIKELGSFSRTSVDEATNQLTLSYLDRNTWKQRPVSVQDLGAIEIAGQVIAGTSQYAGICDPSLANIIALRDLRTLSAPLASARLTAIVPKRVRLLPGDLVTFSSPKNGIGSIAMRITSARYSKPGEALCELELVEDVFKSGLSVYADPAYIAPGAGGSGGVTTTQPGTVSAANLHNMNAPYALTGNMADMALIYALAPNVNTTGYDLLTCEGGTWSDAAAEWYNRRNIGFAATGTLSAVLGATDTPTSLTVNINSTNAAVLRSAVLIGATLCFIGSEMFLVDSITVNTAGTQATLTGITRAVYDTLPSSYASGSTITMLCDYVVDDRQLKTTVYGEPGKVYAFYEGQTGSVLKAQGRNGTGVAPLPSTAASNNGDNTQFNAGTNPPGSNIRAALPVNVGRVRLGSTSSSGSLGSDTSAGAVGVPRSSTMYVNWGYRSKAGRGVSSWFNPEGVPDSNILIEVSVEKLVSSSWVSIASAANQPANVGSSLSFSTTGLPVGTKLRAIINVYVADAGLYGYRAKTQTWYWSV